MTPERYVVLGLARPRAPWFAEITRWATTASVPVEFVKCLSAEEARARLASGRRWSAFLVDGGSPGIDRDLLEAAVAVGATPLVVADHRPHRDWRELGAVGILPEALGRDDLLLALAEHARPVTSASPVPREDVAPGPPPWRGRLVAVTGTGGSGSSTVAALTAHGFGSDVREQNLVVLADLALDADQAVIHDAGDIVPGLPELVDAHRLGRPDVEEVRRLAFHGGRDRPYDLLLGLRRHRDWTALRPRAVDAALDGLRQAYRTVVVDVDSDVEGERDTGSVDVEERNLLARSALRGADAAVIVGRADVVGIHRLARILRDLAAFGVAPERLLPVVNRAPRSPHAKAELAMALAALGGPATKGMSSPTFLQERRRLDDIVRSGGPWPAALARQLSAAVEAVLDRPSSAEAPVSFERVVPGSLGSYSDAESDAS